MAENQPERRMLSAVEIKNFKGKLRCLDKLVERPRARHPEIVELIDNLYQSLIGILEYGRNNYDVHLREVFELDISDVSDLEDVVIRFCHSTKSLSEVYQDIERAFLANSTVL